jgi:transcription initiation factor TFIIB
MTEEKLNNKIVQNNVDAPLIVEKIRECPECGSKNLITDHKRAETSCADCGAIIAENIVNLGAEWRAFDKEQRARRERTGPPTDRYRTDHGLGTLPREVPGVKSRIAKTRPSDQKTLFNAYGEANRICVALGLPKTIENEAKDICKMAKKENLFQNMGIDRVVAAAVLITCQRNGIPRIAKEICDVSLIKDFKKILSGSKIIKRRLEIRATSNRDPSDFLPSFCSKLGLNMQVETLAREIIEMTKEQSLFNGKKPNGIAAAAIYIATYKFGKWIKEDNISKIAYVSCTTIRKRVDEIIGDKLIYEYVSFLDKM